MGGARFVRDGACDKAGFCSKLCDVSTIESSPGLYCSSTSLIAIRSDVASDGMVGAWECG